jgi:hypothetical protein
MKKLLFLAASSMLVFSCSKETNTPLTNELSNTANEVQLSIAEAFTVGTVSSNGTTSFSYSIDELEAICACAVGESNAAGLKFELNQSGDYFLTGNASSDISQTTFAVELNRAGDQLIWASSNTVLACKSSSSEACTLNLGSGLEYNCSNPAGTCVETPIGGDLERSEPCDWPWMVKSSTDKDA